jgi:CheY-like chemotaxis protein
MEPSQDSIDLMRVRAELSAGMLSIRDHITQLDRAVAAGGDGTAERRALWRVETLQAGLAERQSQLVERLALASRPTVVLVVEDEILVLISAIDMLEAAGFTVLSASSADEALSLLEGSEMVRALFTDVQMPGSMNGLELARQVHRRWPAVKVLVTSGNELFGTDDLVRGDLFVRKPYRADDVVAALRTN